jgi:uncharacterized protein YjiS (DUF1127 family)
MSQSFVLEPRRASPCAATRLHGLRSLVRAVEIWLIRRQGWHDLSSLDDRLLKDVGISREDAFRKPNGWLGIRPFRVHEYF